MLKRNCITLLFIFISFNIYGQNPFQWPVEGGQANWIITDTFGHRDKQYEDDFDWHAGVDIDTDNYNSSNILAVHNGEVRYARNWQGSGYDETIFIVHFDESQDITSATQYSHLESFDVFVSDQVTAGQDIADGETGVGSHLHFNLFAAHRDDLTGDFPVNDNHTVHPMEILPYANDEAPIINNFVDIQNFTYNNNQFRGIYIEIRTDDDEMDFNSIEIKAERNGTTNRTHYLLVGNGNLDSLVNLLYFRISRA